MQVYLVQHGLAKSKDEDPERPLTAVGREEVERVARAAAAVAVRPAAILHSGKARAEQTAEIFAAHTEPPQGVQAVYYISAAGDVSRVTEDLAAPNGIGLSPDGKRLYVIPSRQAEMLVYDVDGPGKLSAGRTLCRLTQPPGKDNTGGDGMAVDNRGNLYITSATGIQVFDPAGKYLGNIAFPEQPANVTFGGPGRQTLYVTARTGLYRCEMLARGKKQPVD